MGNKLPFTILNNPRKRTTVIVSAAAMAVLVGIGAVTVFTYSFRDGASEKSIGNNPAILTQGNEPAAQTPANHVIVSGGIDTTDGKELSIWLIAGGDNSFAVINKKQDEVLTMSVEAEQKGTLEVGIMSVADDTVYSEIVTGGAGKITITVPEDGKYRIYVKNHSSEEAHFQLLLDEQLTGPIV